MPIVLLGYPVDNGEPDSPPLANFLGGEEWLDRSGEDVCRHATTIVPDAQLDVGARLERTIVISGNTDLSRLNGDSATLSGSVGNGIVSIPDHIDD